MNFFRKGNNLDELINIPTKDEDRFIIQISFWTQDPNIKTGTIRNPRQKLQPIHDPLCFQNPRICSIFRTNPQSVRFLKPNPSIRKPIHPPPYNKSKITPGIVRHEVQLLINRIYNKFGIKLSSAKLF